MSRVGLISALTREKVVPQKRGGEKEEEKKREGKERGEKKGVPLSSSS